MELNTLNTDNIKVKKSMLEMLKKEINDLCILQDKYNNELIALFQKKSKNIYKQKKNSYNLLFRRRKSQKRTKRNQQ
jgi:hypothetical protein